MTYKVLVVFFMIVSIILLLYYFYKKYKTRNYIFSPFNLTLFTSAFTLYVVPFFMFKDEGWYALGVASAASMEAYLYKAWALNLIGFTFTEIFMIYAEFSANKRKNGILKINYYAKRIDGTILDVFFVPICLCWYAIVLIYNKGLPLLNGGRTFYLGTVISPIYLALNGLLDIYAIYYGLRFIKTRKGLVYFIIATLTVLWQGNRGSFITSTLYAFFCFLIYKGYITVKRNESISQKKRILLLRKSKKVILQKIIIVCVILLVLGLLLSIVRSGSGLNGLSDIEKLINELIYGNTFSDIRDGAFILKGFEETLNNEYVLGKTLFAGVLSFIPSSLSSFRTEWGWGRFSTTMLFGWTEHAGLRGGNIMEAYINFGWLGIVLFGCVQGYFNGLLERWFYNSYLMQKSKCIDKEYLIVGAISTFASIFTCSSGFFNFYLQLIFLALIILLSKNSIRISYEKSKRKIGVSNL